MHRTRVVLAIAATLCLTAAGAAMAGDAPQAPPAAPPAAAAPAAPAVSPPKGYLLFRSEFPDPQAIKPYGRAIVPLAAKFGGRFIALADQPEAVEGAPDTRRLVILEFPSIDAARAFWSSPEYAEVKKLREGIGHVEAVLFAGS